METIGLFRTRVGKDGSVDIWAKGWRLESQLPVLVPVAIAIAFLFSPFPVTVRSLGCALLLACAWVTLRLSKIGFRADGKGITVNQVIRSRSVPWIEVDGFIGARNEHEGRCVLLTADGDRLPSPGTLDPDEMDPFWGDGEVSAVDQLNRLATRLRRAFTAGDEPMMAIDLTVAEDEHPDPEPGSPGGRRLHSR
jgi:hypothetical protein